jgi:hypothetical protein
VGVGKEFTASEVCQKAMEFGFGGHGFNNQDLFDAFSRDGKRVSAKSIGNTLMSIRDRVCDDHHVERVTASDKTSNTYVVIASSGSSAEPASAEDEIM